MDIRISALSRRQLFGAAAALAILLLLLLRHLGGSGNAAPAVTPVQPVAKPKAAAPKLVVVDVAGAVRRPGLYRLREGSRIDDAITSAGGPTAKAQLGAVNLAAPVADGEQVVVPGRGAAGVVPAAAPAAGSSPSAPLDLNSATLEQLENLPGIGPVTAQKILFDARAKVGHAHRIAEPFLPPPPQLSQAQFRRSMATRWVHARKALVGSACRPAPDWRSDVQVPAAL